MPDRTAPIVDLLASRWEDYRTNHFVQACPEPLIAVDRDWHYLLWNRAMEALTGIPAEAVMGWRCYDAFPILVKVGSMQRLEEAFDGHTSMSLVPFCAPKTNFYAMCQSFRRPIYGPCGTIIGALVAIKRAIRVEPFPWPFTPEEPDTYPEALARRHD